MDSYPISTGGKAAEAAILSRCGSPSPNKDANLPEKKTARQKKFARSVPSTTDSRRVSANGPKPTAYIRFALLALLVVVSTVVVYSPVRQHGFVNYDDDEYVVRNTHVHSGLTPDSLTWALTSTATGNWHPLTWMSHALDCQLFGLDPSAHHLTNVVFHALSTLLLAWILNVVTGAPIRSVIVAGLFGLHPLNVESVAWVAERKNVLSTFFFLLALVAYGRYVSKPRIARYVGLVITFLLALAAKPMVVTLPFVLLLADYWPLQRVQGWSDPNVAYRVPQVRLSQCLREKIPLFLMSATGSVVTMIAQRAGGAVKTLQAFSFLERLSNASHAYATYLWKAVWPVKLAAFYPHPGHDLAAWPIGLSLLFLTITSWTVWNARKKAPYLIVGWLWFLGTMVPVIGIVQVGAQGMADRYAYVPMIGIFVAVVWGLADLCSHYRVNARWPVAAACAVLLSLGWLTWKQVACWHDSYALWSHALAVTPDNPMSESQMGLALIALNREEDAMPYFQKAIALGTHDPTSYLNLGSYLSEHGQQQDAIPILETALAMHKDAENALLANLNLGFAYTSTGDYERARRHYRAAWQLDPDGVEETIRALAQFAAAHPSTRDYMKLGLLWEEAEQNSQATIAFERALQIDPGFAPASTELSVLKTASH